MTIPYGYCQCGCGQRTNLARGSNARLTESQVAEIRHLAEMLPRREIGRRYEISPGHLDDILAGRAWAVRVEGPDRRLYR